MPTKIRLSRHGKTHRAFYHIVVADGRAPRDGRFIEKIGTYNPITDPAEIDLDFDRALHWVQTGAQPTDTARAILSHKGVLYKSHLMNGVRKGAFTEAEAEVKFQKWLEEKEAKIASKQSSIDEKARNERKAQFEAEAKINEERAAELAKKKAAEVDAKVKAAQEAAAEKEAEEANTVEETPEETTLEAAAPAEEAETPVEAKEEAETPAEPEAKTEEPAEEEEKKEE